MIVMTTIGKVICKTNITSYHCLNLFGLDNIHIFGLAIHHTKDSRPYQNRVFDQSIPECQNSLQLMIS